MNHWDDVVNATIGTVATVIAFFIGNSLMFFFGAISYIFVGGNDIFEVMIRLNLFYMALLVLGLNIWTTNDNALYTAGLGLANIFHQKKAGVILGAIVANVLPWGISSINGMIVALVCYLIGYFCRKR